MQIFLTISFVLYLWLFNIPKKILHADIKRGTSFQCLQNSMSILHDCGFKMNSKLNFARNQVVVPIKCD